MSERFVFTQHPTVAEIERKAESAKGETALLQIHTEFSSVADVLMHTNMNAAGNTVIHLPDGDHITLVNVTRHELVTAVRPYIAYLDSNFFVGLKM